MTSFKNNEGKIIVENLIKVIQANKEYLSKIDGEIGDGDHGINMNKGFTICGERIADKDVDFTEALKTLAMVLMMEIGGSMGPLYGTMFMEMFKVTKDKENIDKYIFYEMLNAAVKGIQQIGNAKVGDKTLIDTLVPALETYKEELDADSDFTIALEKMCEAAEKGKDSTINLVAKIGRASRLGERSRGVLDAGATSSCLIIQNMAHTMIKLIK